MAKIDIERPHSLGKSRARALVEELAASLRERYGLKNRWQGDALEFSGSGVDGIITVGTHAVRVTAQLGLLLSPLRGKIEQDIRARLDKYLS